MKNILIIGSGGREYALGLKLVTQNHENVTLFYIGSSSNAGLDKITKESFIINIENNSVIVEKAKEWKIDLAIIGPEIALQNGIVDDLQRANILCFGPTKLASQIETSKFFARNLLKKSKQLCEYNPNFYYVENMDDLNRMNLDVFKDFVIKPDGLHGGKGVKVGGVHFSTNAEGRNYVEELIATKSCGSAGPQRGVLIEQKIVGQEFSFMSFTDGTTVLHTIPIKDYKRAYENDMGPNTGSMGSTTDGTTDGCSDSDRQSFLTDTDIETAKMINETVVKEMNVLFDEDHNRFTFKGVLYGSFIKEQQSNTLKVIEFNARFGDPECINMLALLESNLLDVLLAVANERLADIPPLKFSSKASCFKYLVPNGYPDSPEKGELVTFCPENFAQHELIFANISTTKEGKEGGKEGQFIELGSRTLGIIKLEDTCSEAALKVNMELTQIQGPLRYRKDIGLDNYSNDGNSNNVVDLKEEDAYSKAGVNIDEGNRVVREIKSAVESTFTEHVYSNFGDFAGMIRIPNASSLSSKSNPNPPHSHPNPNPHSHSDTILVASTDGVGTKSILVLETFGPEKGYEMLGQDLVNHCINDTLVKGARPLFFLDYFGAHSIKAEHVKHFVQGIAKSCKEVGCALLGGETAEMPDIYKEGHSEVSGTMIGIVNEQQIIDGKKNIKEGDVVVGIPSSGPHTNGYTLIRKVIKEYEMQTNTKTPDTILHGLCATHRNYLPDIDKLQSANIDIHGLCHITGGGFIENPKRIIPEGLDLKLEPFEYSDVFKYIQRIGNISDKDMMKTFNCGYGMLVFLNQKDADEMTKIMLEAKIIGKITK